MHERGLKRTINWKGYHRNAPSAVGVKKNKSKKFIATHNGTVHWVFSSPMKHLSCACCALKTVMYIWCEVVRFIHNKNFPNLMNLFSAHKLYTVTGILSHAKHESDHFNWTSKGKAMLKRILSRKSRNTNVWCSSKSFSHACLSIKLYLFWKIKHT